MVYDKDGYKPQLPKHVGATLNDMRREDVYFEAKDIIDHGGFGHVIKAQNRATKGCYAQKLIRKLVSSSEALKSEILFQMTASNAHVTSIIVHFDTEKYHSIIMLPVADCDPVGYLLYLNSQRDKANFGDCRTKVLQWIFCLVSTIHYVHNLNVVHQDIKPRNVLIYKDWVLLTDFGIAYARERATDSRQIGIGGSYEWVMPKALLDSADKKDGALHKDTRKFTGPAGDIWALGCVFYEMLSEATPPPYIKRRLPSGQDFKAYHRKVQSKSPLVDDVKEIEENKRATLENLGERHAGYVGLTKDLLTIAAQYMITENHQKNAAWIAQEILCVMDDKSFNRAPCCLHAPTYYLGRLLPTPRAPLGQNGQ